MDESTPQGGKPLDENYSISDFAPEAIATAVADCAKFQAEQAANISEAELLPERAGHCFWLNRNGHGSGFWDEYGANDPRQSACNRLSDACDGHAELSPYLGDDKQIYFA